jgi:hypothetical protein
MNVDLFEVIVKTLVLMLFAAMIITTAIHAYLTLVRGWVGKPPVQHLANVIVSATLSLIVVLVLNYTVGDIKLELWKLKFEGAAGPVFLWIFCFLAVIYGFFKLSATKVGNTNSDNNANNRLQCDAATPRA